MLEPHLERLKDFFYDQMGQQTSACIYGSAASGDWVLSRSDLDLLIIIPKEKLELLGAKVRAWDRISTNPILDGYAVFLSGSSLEAISLERLAKVNYPSSERIRLIDQWYIRNRSKKLFGTEQLHTLFPEVSIEQLRISAFENLRELSKGTQQGGMPKLSRLIWTVSWASRMLMLSRGQVCESKREALQWLANEYSEISSLIALLLKDFYKSDDVSMSITQEQSVLLSKACIELAQKELVSHAAKLSR